MVGHDLRFAHVVHHCGKLNPLFRWAGAGAHAQLFLFSRASERPDLLLEFFGNSAMAGEHGDRAQLVRFIVGNHVRRCLRQCRPSARLGQRGCAASSPARAGREPSASDAT